MLARVRPGPGVIVEQGQEGPELTSRQGFALCFHIVRSLQGLHSQRRGCAWALGSESGVLTSGMPGNSWKCCLMSTQGCLMPVSKFLAGVGWG